GILLLQSFNPGEDPYASTVRAGATTPTQPRATTHTTPLAPTTTTTAPARPPAEVRVLAANGSGHQGAGARVQRVLAAAHYNALSATNATGPAVQTSTVQYTPGYQADAMAVA